MVVKGFKDLKVWQKGREIRVFFSDLTKGLPETEKFLLKSQIKRASRSITNNIAEGYGRFHYQENAQFCRQSRGSVYELLDHLSVALDEGYLDKKIYQEAEDLISEYLPILNGYIKYLINAKKNVVEEKEINYAHEIND